MIKRVHSEDYNFYADSETGLTMRWGKTINEDPVSAPWPELADISISNYCTKNCEFCYRDSSPAGAFMSVGDYSHVLDQLTSDKYGSVFQVALGGGEPLEHPDFAEIIELTARRNIIPNFTTNGLHLNYTIAGAIAPYVGAVAMSAGAIRDIDRDKIEILLSAGVKTNIHFVLGDRSVDDAIKLLRGEKNELLDGVNSIIFLTYKPKGRADSEKCLKTDARFFDFLSLVEDGGCSSRIGFDACFVPPLLRYTNIKADYVDSCECGFFSVYIDEYMTVKPCSFTVGNEYSFNLREYDFSDIWKNRFEPYRQEICGGIHCGSECRAAGIGGIGCNGISCRGNCRYFKELQFCRVNV